MWLGGGVQGGQLRRQRGGVGGDRGLGGERHGGFVDRLGGGLVGGGHRRGWGRGRRGRDVRGLGVVKRGRGKVGLRGGLVETLGRGRGRGRRGVVGVRFLRGRGVVGVGLFRRRRLVRLDLSLVPKVEIEL